MLLIECPHCGPRAQIEFTYGGDASVKRPDDPDKLDDRAWFDHVYFRDNPRGRHVEWWQHSAGCRAWIQVERDTLTHEVFESAPADSKSTGSGK